MSICQSRWVAACLAGAITALPIAVHAQGQSPERTRYIVVFKANTTDVRQQAEAMANGAASRTDFVYEHALKGFAVTLPTRTAGPFLEAMRRHPLVESIETDATVQRQQTTQPGATWGLQLLAGARAQRADRRRHHEHRRPRLLFQLRQLPRPVRARLLDHVSGHRGRCVDGHAERHLDGFAPRGR